MSFFKADRKLVFSLIFSLSTLQFSGVAMAKGSASLCAATLSKAVLSPDQLRTEETAVRSTMTGDKSLKVVEVSPAAAKARVAKIETATRSLIASGKITAQSGNELINLLKANPAAQATVGEGLFGDCGNMNAVAMETLVHAYIAGSNAKISGGNGSAIITSISHSIATDLKVTDVAGRERTCRLAAKSTCNLFGAQVQEACL